MSLHPARDEQEAKRRRDAIELCGKNRGPHDYFPIEWNRSETAERVTRMMCRVCFSHVSMKTLIENYPDVSVLKTESN